MAYFAPYIDAKGFHLPTYEDRLEALVSSYRSIFGAEINLEPSSPDYQLMSVFARALDDLSQLLLADFNSRNPAYASGAALDLLMPLFHLTRQGATFSTVALTLTGTPGATLGAAPQALDDAGHLWVTSASSIPLDENGTATVQAVCSDPGAIAAPAGTIRHLVSPVSGLASVVNQTAATPGQDAETDASCRNRLRLASAAPASGTLEALKSALQAVPGVRALTVYENDTDETDAHGLPPHSLCVVSLGGLTATLARILFDKKPPGIGTYGSVSTSVQDAFGHSHTIRLQRASQIPVALSIELKPLAGFDETVVDRIRSAILEYANTLQIGQDLVVPSLYGICYAQDPGSSPTFSISLLSASAQGTSTGGILTPAWNQRFMIPGNMIQILISDP